MPIPTLLGNDCTSWAYIKSMMYLQTIDHLVFNYSIIKEIVNTTERPPHPTSRIPHSHGQLNPGNSLSIEFNN